MTDTKTGESPQVQIQSGLQSEILSQNNDGSGGGDDDGNGR